MGNYQIKQLNSRQVRQTGAMALVCRVFMEFEAPEYTAEGIQEFQDFIASDGVQKRMQEGQLVVWGCFDKETIIGVIAIRPVCHVSLLFVDKAYHRQGIARRLLTMAVDYLAGENGCKAVTVHASPYALVAYEKLGFVATGEEQTINGLRFTPMCYAIK